MFARSVSRTNSVKLSLYPLQLTMMMTSSVLSGNRALGHTFPSSSGRSCYTCRPTPFSSCSGPATSFNSVTRCKSRLAQVRHHQTRAGKSGSGPSDLEAGQQLPEVAASLSSCEEATLDEQPASFELQTAQHEEEDVADTHRLAPGRLMRSMGQQLSGTGSRLLSLSAVTGATGMSRHACQYLW